MTQRLHQEPFTPWYKEPWAWYIAGILVATFCWGSFQVYTAFTHQDSVVIDDYYQAGKVINLDMTRQEEASRLAIRGSLTIDDMMGEVHVRLQGDIQQWPQQLKLSFLSPAFKDQDKTIDLRLSASGAYVGQLPEKVAGRYYVQLETLDELKPEVGYESGWKLSSEAIIEPGTPLHLQAANVQ